MRNNSLSSSVTCCLIFLFVFFFLPASLTFSDELSLSDKHEIINKLTQARKNIHSIRADLKQEKNLSALKEKINIRGTIILKKPDLLRLDTEEPFKSQIAFDGKTMTIYHPDINEAEIYDTTDNKKAQYAMKFFSSSLWSSLEEMEKEFNVSLYHQDSKVVFELSPLSMVVARYLTSIVVYYEEKTGIPLQIISKTPHNDTIVTTLANIEINPEVKPETFTIKMPENVWIITADQ